MGYGGKVQDFARGNEGLGLKEGEGFFGRRGKYF